MSSSSPMSPSALSFSAPLCLLLHTDLNRNRYRSLSRHPVRRRARRRARRRLQPLTAALFGDGEPPDLIKRLDLMEKIHRDNQGEPEPGLSEEDEELLLNKLPSLRRLRTFLDEVDKDVQANRQPDDAHIYTWAYNLLNRHRISRLTRAVAIALLLLSLRSTLQHIHARYTTAFIFSVITALESFAIPVFAVAPAVALLLYVMTRRRGDASVDGTTRTLTMYLSSSLALAPVAAIAATAPGVQALALGTAVRLVLLLPALWYWTDLRREVALSLTMPARMLRIWRVLVTVAVLLPGVVLRVLALSGCVAPLAQEIVNPARVTRLALAARFPVAFSLCADPRAMYLMACIMLAVPAVYLFFLAIFPLDLLQVRVHRKSRTPITRWLVSRGVYQPDVHPEQERGRLSTGDPTTTYIPSRVMLMRHKDGMRDVDSSYLSSDIPMPVLSLLDEEEETMKREGATEWMKSRFEQVPLSEDYSEEKRAMDALLSWARPLGNDETDTSFEDFFQTINEGQYKFDNDSETWVFNDDEKDGAGNAATNDGVNPGDRVIDFIVTEDGDDDGEPLPDLPPGVPDVAPGTSVRFTASADMQPYLKKFLEDMERSDGDGDGITLDDDDEPTQVYV